MEKPFRPLAGMWNWPVSSLELVGLSCIGNSDGSPLTSGVSPDTGEGGGAPGTARPTSAPPMPTSLREADLSGLVAVTLSLRVLPARRERSPRERFAGLSRVYGGNSCSHSMEATV